MLLWLIPKISHSVVSILWYPAERVRVWMTESNSTLPMLLRERQELLEDIRRLEMKIATEQGTDSTIRRLQIENEQLRALVGAVPEERILARVVARPPQLPYDYVMIDRGARDGVLEGAPVFAGKDAVIGIITFVSERVSYARLVSDPAVTITVFIVGPNIFTIAEGLGNGVVRVRVPQGIIINKSDIVLLPAVDTGILGQIEEIVTSPTNPERHGYIVLPSNIQSLRYISVGAEPISTPDFSEVTSAIGNHLVDLLSVPVPPEFLVQPDVIAVPDNVAEISTVVNDNI